MRYFVLCPKVDSVYPLCLDTEPPYHLTVIDRDDNVVNQYYPGDVYTGVRDSITVLIPCISLQFVSLEQRIFVRLLFSHAWQRDKAFLLDICALAD